METREAIANGALEIDFVINVGELKNRNYRYIYNEIKAIVDACAADVTVKVIFEVCLLTPEEIIDVAILSVAAGAHFVKTSTGFSTSGATPEAIDSMLTVVGPNALVKASGGVRDKDVVLQYLRAGVRRIGTSAGIDICKL
uniref:Deoxyribose-phosphate aldolase n=1 Tax=Lygus hesperus TaxID=30085 RepID=A0A0A9WKJ5_LYGHE